jgi:hypothetical protein
MVVLRFASALTPKFLGADCSDEHGYILMLPTIRMVIPHLMRELKPIPS